MISYCTLIIVMKIILLFIIACNCNRQQAGKDEDSSSYWSDRDTIIIWSVDAEKNMRTRIFTPEDSIDNAAPLMNGIHKLWPEARLFVSGQRSDTLIVGLRNERWLTDEIGNEGAESFLSFASLNLLELKGVNHIFFNIIPGTHAGSDTWESSDFADWKEGK
jgi:hypothetical protein